MFRIHRKFIQFDVRCAGELLDIRGVIRATTEGLESGELLRLNLAVIDAVEYSYECVQGSGFRVQGSGFRVQGSGFRVQGSGFRV